MLTGLLAVQFAAATPTVRAAPDDPQIPAGASRLVAVTPCRLLDHRDEGATASLDGERLDIAGRCGVPDDATAVVLTLTSDGGTRPGFATVWPAGQERPIVASLNVSPGDTRSNGVTVKLGDGGAVELASTVDAPLIVDVTAAYVPVEEPTNAGRYVPVVPFRALDTRETGQRGVGDIDVPIPAGVPADATALAVNVSIVESASAGFLTVHANGTERPVAATATVDGPGQTRSVGAVVPVSPAGLRLFRSMRADVVVDVTGWFTGPSAEAGTDGLFVPVDPVRMWDTRTATALTAGGGLERQLVDESVRGQVVAVVANIASDAAFGAGWIAAGPAGVPSDELVASVNPEGAAATSNMAIVPVSDRGAAFTSLSTTDVIVDVYGWYTGTPYTATAPVPLNPVPAPPRTLMVSDSVFASLRWEQTLDVLRGTEYVTDLQSCRRLIGASCRGREGFAPSNALDAVAAADGMFDVVVIAVGYNDPASTFSSSFEQVVTAARGKGARRIIWVTYREDTNYRSPFGWTSSDVFASHNATLRAHLASGNYPDVVLADWWDYTGEHPEWFPDGIHHSEVASVAAADWLSRWVAHVSRRPCPVWETGARVCAHPDERGLPTNVWSLYREGDEVQSSAWISSETDGRASGVDGSDR